MLKNLKGECQMRNTISDLNNYLFETLEKLSDDSLDNEEMDKELKRSKAITNVAKTIIDNGKLGLDVMKHLNDYGYNNSNVNNEDLAPVPAMLRVNG